MEKLIKYRLTTINSRISVKRKKSDTKVFVFSIAGNTSERVLDLDVLGEERRKKQQHNKYSSKERASKRQAGVVAGMTGILLHMLRAQVVAHAVSQSVARLIAQEEVARHRMVDRWNERTN